MDRDEWRAAEFFLTQICIIAARPLVGCCDSRLLSDGNDAVIIRDYLDYLDRWVATTI